MSGEPPYAGPPISRHVAGLLGIPLDDPDVLPEGVPYAWSDWLSPEDSLYDESDCGDCVVSGSEVCTFACHGRCIQ